MAKLEIPIKQPTRGCTVDGRPGYFHLWEHYSEPIPASLGAFEKWLAEKDEKTKEESTT